MGKYVGGKIKYNVYKGDVVAERTKAADATRTVAGSNLGHGRHFSSGSTVSEENCRRPPPGQIPMGAH